MIMLPNFRSNGTYEKIPICVTGIHVDFYNNSSSMRGQTTLVMYIDESCQYHYVKMKDIEADTNDTCV